MQIANAQLLAAGAGTISAPAVAWAVLSLHGQHPDGLAVGMTMFLLLFGLPFVFALFFGSVTLAHWLTSKLPWPRIIGYPLFSSLSPAVTILVTWLLIFRVPPHVLIDEPEYVVALGWISATAAAPGLLAGLVMLALAPRSSAAR